jgi:hypothetical protein
MSKVLASVTLLLAMLAAVGAGAQAQVSAQTRSPHGNLNIPCQNCHTSLGWKPIRAVPEFDHNKTSYPLRGMHENVSCTQCHTKSVFANVGSKCADCHADIHRGQMGARCEQCHTVKGWNIAVKDIQNHENRFPLVGAHAAVECDSCHKSAAVGQFQGLSTQCYSCHADIFKKTINPNHVAGGFSTSCDTCHGMNNWLNAKFDHSQTGFALTGMHQSTPCASCHVNNNYNLTAANATCVSCHHKAWQKAKNPDHVAGQFSQNCQQCHSTAGWSPATFDHASVGFALTGGHATVQCAQCHVNNNYQLTSKACSTCHMTDYNNTNNPNHAQQGISTSCENCHTVNNWTGAAFDHSGAGFPLTGGHANVPCSQCHINNNYNLTSKACSGCHMTDYNNTNNPNHKQQGIATTCEVCHAIAGWTPASFDHSKTGFALTGGHASPPLTCAQCHVNNNYNITNATCVSCHQTDYNNATTPVNHVQLNFPTSCQTCHDTVLWTDGKFDHSTTGWALTGFHLTSTQCSQCHTNNNYNLTSANTTCVSCHQTDYNTAKTPVDHVALGFPTTCQNCHDTVVWTDGKFDHASTGWPLTGFHLTSTQCAQCHVNNNYKLTTANTVCSSCHIKDYNTATTPVNHVSAGLPTTCELCHDTVLWTDGKFDHTTTGWPLTGTHATTQCAQCHVNNNYKLTNTACVACHQADYNGAVSPVNHIQLGFPNTCQSCHDTVVWTDGKFDHASTGWALTGFHTGVPCASCHVNNNYSLTSANTLCSSCHMADWNATTNPKHSAAGWPTTCNTCHTTSAWIPASLPLQYHTFFPPNHGNANSVCTTCHQNPNDFSVFQCTNCHQKSKTDSNHQGVNGYVYNSINCYNCHKSGGGG